VFGIVGRGRIGEAVARLARGIGMRVIFAETPGLERTQDELPLDELLARSDAISLHLPLTPGQTVVDLSTITHSTTTALAGALSANGIAFLDAPISGMQARAVDGTLTVMCGGEREVFDRVKPFLDCIGNTILFMGPAGSGQLTKLINQLLFDINAAALAEILPMAVKLGLDPGLVGEVVNSGTGRSYASEFFVPRILRGHFSDGYPMAHAYKDLVSGAELGANHCVPMPVLAAATATYQTALLKGHGQRDKGAMVQVFEEILGVQVRARSTQA
jgi:3-hydroxyisobutyrate dehydrogenase-like beta-hydroxyacid dehydrogenase